MGEKERKARETWEEKKHKWGLAAIYAAMLLSISYAFVAFCFFVVGGLAAYAGLNIAGLYFILFYFYLGTVFGLYHLLDHLKVWDKPKGEPPGGKSVTKRDEHETHGQLPEASKRSGEMLVKSNLITDEQLKKALAQQSTSGGRLGSNLVKMGYISEEDLANFLSRQYGIPFVNLEQVEIDPNVFKLVHGAVARKHTVIPIKLMGNCLTVAVADPSNIFAIDDVHFLSGFPTKPVVATETQIRNAINRYYHSVEVGPRGVTA